MESGAAADVRCGRRTTGPHPFSLRCCGRADKGRRGSLRPAGRHADHGRLRRFCGFFSGLAFGLSPFLIIATDSILLIVLNTVLQRYGGAELGDALITCATIVQSYLLLITMPIILL